MTVSYYYSQLFEQPRVLPEIYPPRVEEAVHEIHKACKGVGTNERTIIRALTIVNEVDRELVTYRYQQVHNRNLADLIKSETSGNYGYLARLLSMPLHEMEAFILHSACSGLGTTEKVLYPIVMGRTPEELELLKRTYFNKYNRDLGTVLESDLSGDLKKVIMTAIQAQVVPFNPDFHTEEKAQIDAEKLYSAGEGKWGTDEESFISILLSSPPEYLLLLDSWYAKKYNSSIRHAVEKEFHGHAKKALLFYVGLSLDPIKEYAERLERAMKGIGTDEKTLSIDLIRIRPFLKDVSQEYERLFNKSLKDRIKGDTSGDYEELLLALLDAPSIA